ncbi:MAG: dihydrolipoyl dehydrogenase [Rickettsiales bacterium]
MYDVAVIGGGPGGYVAAIKAAQLGLKVACVEKRGSLGGTCLNVGCIPSKTLLHISHLYEQARHEFADMGIEVKKPEIDVKTLMKRKEAVVNGLESGIQGLLKKNKVDYIKGHASFVDAHTLAVQNDEGERRVEAKNVIIATGSKVAEMPSAPFDGKHIVSSDHAIAFSKPPKKLVVLGGGVIGLELGSVWRRLGSEVTIIEYADDILPTMDGEVSKLAKKLFEKQGITFRLAQKLTSASVKDGKVKIHVEPRDGGEEEKLEADALLVAVGRRPNTDGLRLENAGVAATDRGVIPTDGKLRTNVPHIYAVGDVTDGPMLAHKAEEEGVAAAEIIAGQAGCVHYDLIPGVVYTFPEIASVGKTEERLKKEGVEYNKGKFPFAANSRARTTGETDGFVKILARKDNDEILGVHIVGPQAGTLIGEACVAMAYKASSEDVARICHSHPDLNEAMKEAALATHFKAIHM